MPGWRTAQKLRCRGCRRATPDAGRCPWQAVRVASRQGGDPRRIQTVGATRCARERGRLRAHGASVVGGRGTRFTDPVTGADLTELAGWRVDAHPSDAPAYRDFSLFMQDEDEIIGTAQMPYTEHVAGVVGLNYRSEPLLPRLAS